MHSLNTDSHFFPHTNCIYKFVFVHRLSTETLRPATSSSRTTIRAKWLILDSHVMSLRPKSTNARAKENCLLGKVDTTLYSEHIHNTRDFSLPPTHIPSIEFNTYLLYNILLFVRQKRRPLGDRKTNRTYI